MGDLDALLLNLWFCWGWGGHPSAR